MRDLILNIADLFADPARVSQGEGAYRKDAPCCVGAHLANYFGVAEGYSLDFLDGAEMLGGELGANRAHLVLMLRASGAGWDPFGREAWDDPPGDVFRKLAEIEDMPDTTGADFSGVCFEKADMRFAQLQNCSLKFTEMTDGDFEEANFTGADLEGASFVTADLRGAEMKDAYLAHASLQDANLTHANLSGAYVEAADFEGADLDGCDFAGANPLDCANFAGCYIEAAKNLAISNLEG